MRNIVNLKNSKINSRGILLAAALGVGLTPALWAYDIPVKKEVSPKKPVEISAEQLTYDRLESLTLFKGEVRAVHDHVVLTADEIRAVSANREASAVGHVRVVDPTMGSTITCGSLEYLDLMNTMTAHDRPELTTVDSSGQPMTITGRQMEMDSKNKTVVIHQNVRILDNEGRAEAQKATYFSKEDKLVLEEDPEILMPNGELSGRRIVSGLGNDQSVLVEGMAEAVFYPKAQALPPDKNPSGPTLPLKGSEKSTEAGVNALKTSPNPQAAQALTPVPETRATPTPGVWGGGGNAPKFGGH